MTTAGESYVGSTRDAGMYVLCIYMYALIKERKTGSWNREEYVWKAGLRVIGCACRKGRNALELE